MKNEKHETCPTCKGEKIITGICECNQEWRGSKIGEDWEDCRCTPDQECPNCLGKGYVN